MTPIPDVPGVAAMWEVVESSPVPVALIEIGPDC